MILSHYNRTVNAEKFAAALAQAMRGMVLVTIGGGASTSSCTGWMLTPRLAVVPSHVLTPGEPVRVGLFVNEQLHWSEITEGTPEELGDNRYLHPRATGTSLGVAIVVIKPKPRIPTLQFRQQPLPPGAPVSILSFARGENRLYLSMGAARSNEAPYFSYDADTEPGSSGAPVFDLEWRISGVHMLAVLGDPTTTMKTGLNYSALLEMLQKSRYWKEIAALHHLADISSAEAVLEKRRAVASTAVQQEAFLRAALTISFDPKQLDRDDRDTLQDKVIDSRAKRWTLQPSARREALAGTNGGIETLRTHAPKRASSTGDLVIKQILAGPPYDLSANEEDSLSWWIQAASWFRGVVKGLPTPEEVTRELERRRVRSRLTAIAGTDFAGRETELAQLRNWFNQGDPAIYSVTGIGGVGKSALIARFAAQLPPDTLLLWLDFDRADLAPDDAVSVLSALAQQVSVQLDEFKMPALTETNFMKVASEFGTGLNKRGFKHPPLLVMDSFEAAQYTERYAEIWKVSDAIREKLPSLRTIVSGRAPIPPFVGLQLDVLSQRDARYWLETHGIRRRVMVDRILEITGCLPLNLHLAQRLIETGGRIQSIRQRLPPELVAGFLYGRILDRVQSEELKPVSEAALVLRRLTQELAVEVLGAVTTLPPGPPAGWFGELARECALVAGSQVLQLRPEVRAAALKLLEHAKPKLVRAVDERAAAWYGKQPISTPEMAAELVYHRLRLGDLQGAASAWTDGCGELLKYEETNLKGAAQRWLAERRGSVMVSETPLAIWEEEAAERIRDARQRGHTRKSSGVLLERRVRTINSPLIFQEAYEMRAAGETARALAHLQKTGPGENSVARDRSVLRALLLAESGQKYEADVELRLVDERAFAGRPQGNIEMLLVVAARLRLATDIAAEQESVDWIEKNRHGFFLDWVCPIDCVLPAMFHRFESNGSTFTTGVEVPPPGKPREPFAKAIERFRSKNVVEEPIALIRQREKVMRGELVDHRTLEQLLPGPVARVLECGWRRWSIATHSEMFWHLLRTEITKGPLFQALVGSVALFVGLSGLYLEVSGVRVDKTFLHWVDVAEKQFDLRRLTFQTYKDAPDPLVLLVDRLSGKET